MGNSAQLGSAEHPVNTAGHKIGTNHSLQDFTYQFKDRRYSTEVIYSCFDQDYNTLDEKTQHMGAKEA